MKITVEQVEYVARLSRLKLSGEEKLRLTGQLDSILRYMEKLNELDTTGVAPTFQVVPQVNVLREDAVKRPFLREEIMGNAPSSEEGYYKVPRVI